jgi:hypothetical protein
MKEKKAGKRFFSGGTLDREKTCCCPGQNNKNNKINEGQYL